MALTRYVATATTSAFTNTKGSYAQVVASTPYDSSRIHIIVTSTGTTNPTCLIDIATGAASSESVIVSNILVGSSNFIYGQDTVITVDIPAGTRIAIRAQSNFSSTVVTLNIYLENRALGSLANPVTYGATTSTSRGTAIDPGAVASTKGSYVQLSASTSAAINAIMLCAIGDTNGLGTFISWSVDIATGAASSETIIIPDVALVDVPPSNVAVPKPSWLVFPVDVIPAGTRLAVRCSCNNNTAGQRALNVVLIGMQDIATSSGGGATSVAYIG